MGTVGTRTSLFPNSRNVKEIVPRPNSHPGDGDVWTIPDAYSLILLGW